MAEFFDLAELPLNAGDQAWGNLGYWDAAPNYSDACRALATRLGASAQLGQTSRVVDAGFGCGDQLIHWLEHFQVPYLTGINLSHSQTDLARSRLEAAGHSEAAASIAQGNIDDQAAWKHWETASINRVLALDCAYHFPDRAAFLQRAGQLLPKGGRLCLTDFVLTESHSGLSLRGMALAPMLKASRIPPRNIVSLSKYETQLEDAGFHDVEAEDISDWVMQGFAAWLRGYKLANPRRMPRRLWLKYEVTAAFLDWAYRKQVLRYVMISATR